MAMWIDHLLASRTTRAVELAAAFTEQRQQVLAENVANVDTPDYHSKRLDAEVFQSALRDALDRSEGDRLQRVELRSREQVATDRHGRLVTTPVTEPAPNILFHDGTNGRLEKLMTQVTENQLQHSLATKLLQSRYNKLLAAIKGRSG